MSLDTDSQRSTRGDATRFIAWVLGINATLLTAGVASLTGVLWTMNTAITRQTVQIEALQYDMGTFRSDLSAGTQQRYTSADAARDREQLQGQITRNSASIDKLNDRVIRLEVQGGVPGK